MYSFSFIYPREHFAHIFHQWVFWCLIRFKQTWVGSLFDSEYFWGYWSTILEESQIVFNWECLLFSRQCLTADQQPLGFFLLLFFLHSQHHCFVDSVSWSLLWKKRQCLTENSQKLTTYPIISYLIGPKAYPISLSLSPSSFSCHALSRHYPPAKGDDNLEPIKDLLQVLTT